MSDDTTEPGSHSRRTLFKYLVSGIAAAVAAILAVPLGGFFVGPALKKTRAVWKRAGVVNDFRIGEIRLVVLEPLEFPRWPEDWEQQAAWVYRKGDADFVLYDLHCTHVGCPVNWSPQARRFFSPCHGGVFDQEGRVLAGPPPRPLDRYEVKIDKGVLYAGAKYRVDENLEPVG